MNSVFIHEAGHLVIGLRLGIREQGLTFYRTETEAAQAYFTLDTPANNLRRALAGVLAQLAIIPESIEPAVREAFRRSVILDEFHPDYDKVAEGDRAFASGARDDLNVARKAAEAMVGRDRKHVGECLRGHETEARALVAANQAAIIAVAEDVTAWMETVTTDENPCCSIARNGRTVSCSDWIPPRPRPTPRTRATIDATCGHTSNRLHP